MYDYFGNGEDTILGESKQRKRFVKAGRAFVRMQRPRFDADALIYKLASTGISKLRKKAAARRHIRALVSGSAAAKRGSSGKRFPTPPGIDYLPRRALSFVCVFSS